MVDFNEQYYKSIWNSVHRHDYCNSLADSLIAKYGKVRYLDVGTGCGFLVKTLRDKGCDAWGLEISDYALANCDIPEFVRKGDIRDIPFASNRFDVIHSQGVWGYFPEEDIQKAWSECKRVGKHQEHNIDFDPQPPEHQYLFTKSPDWWKNKFYPKILIGTPIHERKEYSLGRWIENVQSFTYPNKDFLVADGSATDALAERWKGKIPVIHIEADQDHRVHQINLCFEELRKAFLAGDYQWLATIECDVIPPPDILETMLDWGRDADWISFSYPNRENQTTSEQGLGCCLFTRKLMEKYDWGSLLDNYTADGGLWMKVKDDTELVTLELYNKVNITHLKE